MTSLQEGRDPSEPLENGGWDMVRQMRSDDMVYRRISSVGTQEVVERSRQSKFGSEIISCAWSPDGSIFAWSVGTQLVSLHSTSQLLPQYANRRTSDSDTGFSVASLNVPPEGDGRKSPVNTADDPRIGQILALDGGQGQSVTCMAFGSRYPDVNWHNKEVKYNRFENIVKNKLLLATGLSNGDIKIWEVASGKLLMILKDHTEAVIDLQFAPDGSLVLVSTSKDNSAKLWNLLDDGNMFQTLERVGDPRRPITSVSWSPDAKRVATGGAGKTAVIRDAVHHKVERILDGHQNDVTACRFSANGKLLFTSSADTRVISWDVDTGNKVHVYDHMSPPPSTIFASGSNGHEVLGLDLRENVFATLCHDGLLRIWKIGGKGEKGAPVAVIEIVPDAKSLSFSDDGKVLAVGCQGGIVQFFAAGSA